MVGRVCRRLRLVRQELNFFPLGYSAKKSTSVSRRLCDLRLLQRVVLGRANRAHIVVCLGLLIRVRVMISCSKVLLRGLVSGADRFVVCCKEAYELVF